MFNVIFSVQLLLYKANQLADLCLHCTDSHRWPFAWSSSQPSFHFYHHINHPLQHTSDSWLPSINLPSSFPWILLFQEMYQVSAALFCTRFYLTCWFLLTSQAKQDYWAPDQHCSCNLSGGPEICLILQIGLLKKIIF